MRLFTLLLNLSVSLAVMAMLPAPYRPRAPSRLTNGDLLRRGLKPMKPQNLYSDKRGALKPRVSPTPEADSEVSSGRATYVYSSCVNRDTLVTSGNFINIPTSSGYAAALQSCADYAASLSADEFTIGISATSSTLYRCNAGIISRQIEGCTASNPALYGP